VAPVGTFFLPKSHEDPSPTPFLKALSTVGLLQVDASPLCRFGNGLWLFYQTIAISSSRYFEVETN